MGVAHAHVHVPPPRVMGETDGEYTARVKLEDLAANYRKRIEGTGDEGSG